MNESYFESIFAIFDEKPFFCLFWTFFGKFLGTFQFDQYQWFPDYWISRIFGNWIIFWIESWVKQCWIKYWINHFLAKFKHWIKSDWVSATTTVCIDFTLCVWFYTVYGFQLGKFYTWQNFSYTTSSCDGCDKCEVCKYDFPRTQVLSLWDYSLLQCTEGSVCWWCQSDSMTFSL